MKKVTLVLRHYGENAGGYDMVGPLDMVADYDPAAMKSVCVSYDNDMLIEVPRDKLVEVEVPEWFDFSEFRSEIAIKYLLAYGYEWSMGENVLRKLYPLIAHTNGTGYYVYLLLNAVIKVKNPRSEFKKSIKAQVEEWLNGQGKYALPLSTRQFAAIGSSHARFAYDRTAAGAYLSRSGIVGALYNKAAA